MTGLNPDGVEAARAMVGDEIADAMRTVAERLARRFDTKVEVRGGDSEPLVFRIPNSPPKVGFEGTSDRIFEPLARGLHEARAVGSYFIHARDKVGVIRWAEIRLDDHDSVLELAELLIDEDFGAGVQA